MPKASLRGAAKTLRILQIVLMVLLQLALPMQSITTASAAEQAAPSAMMQAANASATLDQCANDPAPSPSSNGCDTDPASWVNGNLGASKSVYFEGDSIPYRMLFDNLATTGSHTVTIQWDTTKSSKHALDYLTTFNASVLDANPCLGVTGCGSPTTFAIPADPQVTAAHVTPKPGVFTLYGGTITGVSAYAYSPSGFVGDTSASITITFTASQANPVLAWGGHIATRKYGGPHCQDSLKGFPKVVHPPFRPVVRTLASVS